MHPVQTEEITSTLRGDDSGKRLATSNSHACYKLRNKGMEVNIFYLVKIDYKNLWLKSHSVVIDLTSPSKIKSNTKTSILTTSGDSVDAMSREASNSTQASSMFLPTQRTEPHKLLTGMPEVTIAAPSRPHFCANANTGLLYPQTCP